MTREFTSSRFRFLNDPPVTTRPFSITVDPDKCIGCTACARKCPVMCISGTVKQPHVIDQSLCIKCGACFDTCKFNAIIKK